MRVWVFVVVLGAAICVAGDYPSTSGADGFVNTAVSARPPGIGLAPEAATASFIPPDQPLPGTRRLAATRRGWRRSELRNIWITDIRDAGRTGLIR